MNLAQVSYTRGKDLSGSLQGAGGIGGLLARTDNSLLVAGAATAHAYYHCDGNGNVTALVNTNGIMLARYSYDPYGNLLGMSGPLAEANRYRFSSKEWNGNAGLYYYGYRFYDGGLQRWINRDPIGEMGGENLFTFVEQSPISVVDSMGLDVWVEGPSGDEPAGHQSICVGDPNAEYSGYSFGATGVGLKNGLQGTIYEDVEKGGKIVDCKYYSTTPEVDAIIRNKLDDLVDKEANNRYPYRAINANCRNWSQKQFDLIAEQLEKHSKGKKCKPPSRSIKPDKASPGVSSTRPTSRSTSNPTSAVTCSTEKKTSAYEGECQKAK